MISALYYVHCRNYADLYATQEDNSIDEQNPDYIFP